MSDLLTALTIIVSDVGGAAIGKAQMIDLDKSAEIRGVDTNQNGLRDDFERMLIKKVKNDKDRNMLYHMLSFMDKAVVFGNTKTVDDQDEAVEIFKSYELHLVFQCVPRAEKSIYTFIDKNFPNTNERKQAYAVFNTAFAKAKYRTKPQLKYNCNAFAESIPNYVANEFKENEQLTAEKK